MCPFASRLTFIYIVRIANKSYCGKIHVNYLDMTATTINYDNNKIKT
jgi:hypothetical protein